MCSDQPDIHEQVEEGLKMMSQFSGAIAAVKGDYAEIKKSHRETHDAMIEQTMQLKHVNENIERDRQDRKDQIEKLFDKVDGLAIGMATKAESEKCSQQKESCDKKIDTKISKGGVLLLLGVLSIIFGFITFMANMG